MNCICCKKYGDCPVEKEIDGRDWILHSNGLNGLECSEYKKDFITPEQYERRTGRKWPDDAAVYVRLGLGFYWGVNKYSYAKHVDLTSHVVCAIEDGPPPDDWRPDGE
jgi:hypothetical protein